MTFPQLVRTGLTALLGVSLVWSPIAIPATAFAEEAETELEAQAEPLPAKFDLRDRGLVTPVKRQNPWASCWSFGAIAAAESSILADMGATYTDTGLDLSERHLIFFSMSPITEAQDSSQYGEGLYHMRGEGNNNAAFRTANTIVSSTLFSSGVGPMMEEDYPYRNTDGITEYEYMKAFPDQWKAMVKQEVEEGRGKSIAKMIQENAGNPNFPKTEAEYLQNSWNSYLKTVEATDNYTEYLDWSLDYADRDQSASFVLIDGNRLPEFAVRSNGVWTGVSTQAIEATKRELLKGRAVAVGLHADSSSPTQRTTEGKYIDLKNWAHYTYDNVRSNHEVTIVGWDDDYPRENFLSGTDERGTSRTPPANGAWIVKNSWGSETDAVSNQNGRPVTKGTWGVKNAEGKSTGYFYLSYYDKSIDEPESFRFGTDLSSGKHFTVYQYDYLPATDGFYFAESNGRISTANIFTSGASEEEVLTSIGVRTYAPNTTVENEVYKLPKGVTNPEKGEKVASFKSTFEHGGFHRVMLPSAITLAPGTRFSLVSTGYVTRRDGTPSYGLAANKADSEKYAEDKIKKGNKTWVYGKSVVNKGESLIYWKDGWYDWRECIDNGMSVTGLVKAQDDEAVTAQAEVEHLLVAQVDDADPADAARHPKAIQKGDSVVDNFTLKAYTVPSSAYVAGTAKDNQAPVGEAFSEEYSLKDKGAQVGADEAWPKDGLTDQDFRDYADDDGVVEGPGMPGDGKDYYDADWNGDDPNALKQDAQPKAEEPKTEEPKAEEPKQEVPKQEVPAKDGEPKQEASTSQPETKTVQVSQVVHQTQATTTAEASRRLPDTADETIVPPALLVLVGLCALSCAIFVRT